MQGYTGVLLLCPIARSRSSSSEADRAAVAISHQAALDLVR
jgi:hypothetical protein